MSAPAPVPSAGGAARSNTGGTKRKATWGQRKQLAKLKRRAERESSAIAAATPEPGHHGVDSSSSSDDDSSDSDTSDDEDENEDGTEKKTTPKVKVPKPPTSGRLKNVPMLLITCDTGKEQQAKKEMMEWLIEYADRVYPRAPPTTAAVSESSTVAAPSVSGGLAAELAALKAQQAAANSAASTDSAATARALGLRFKNIPDMSIFRGLILIAFLDSSIPIVEMVQGMVTELRQTKQFRTRYCVHLHPFMQTCYSELESLFKLARTIIPEQFEQILNSSDPVMKTKRKYCVDLVRRGQNDQMDRMKIIETVAALVPKSTDPANGFTVDLKKADVIIHIDVIGRLTGVSVFTHYAEYSKYNIRTLFQEIMGFKQEAAKKDPADQAAAKAAGEEKKRKHAENREKDKAAKKAKLERVAAEATSNPGSTATAEVAAIAVDSK